MVFAQARVGNLGNMASPKMLKCSVCSHSKGRHDYAGPQWAEGSKKRQCKDCRKRLRDAADAPCTLETMTVDQPGVLGSQPAAAGQPTPGGGGAKSTGKASVSSFMVSTLSMCVPRMHACVERMRGA